LIQALGHGAHKGITTQRPDKLKREIDNRHRRILNRKGLLQILTQKPIGSREVVAGKVLLAPLQHLGGGIDPDKGDTFLKRLEMQKSGAERTPQVIDIRTVDSEVSSNLTNHTLGLRIERNGAV